MASIQTIQKVMSQISQTLQHATDVIALDVVLKVPNIPEMIADNMTTADICIQDARRLFAIIKIIRTGVLESKCSFHDGRETILNHITQWTFHTTSILADIEPIVLNPLESQQIQSSKTEPEVQADTKKVHTPTTKRVTFRDEEDSTKQVEEVEPNNKVEIHEQDSKKSKTKPKAKPKRKYTKRKKTIQTDSLTKESKAKAKPKRKYTKKALNDNKKKVATSTKAKKSQQTSINEKMVTDAKTKRGGRKKKAELVKEWPSKKVKAVET